MKTLTHLSKTLKTQTHNDTCKIGGCEQQSMLCSVCGQYLGGLEVEIDEDLVQRLPWWHKCTVREMNAIDDILKDIYKEIGETHDVTDKVPEDVFTQGVRFGLRRAKAIIEKHTNRRAKPVETDNVTSTTPITYELDDTFVWGGK